MKDITATELQAWYDKYALEQQSKLDQIILEPIINRIYEMAIDLKYGKVTTEKGTIGEDEPVVVFRAQDVLLPKVLNAYAYLCIEKGSPQRHIDLIREAVDVVEEWQGNYATKIPSSDGYTPNDRR